MGARREGIGGAGRLRVTARLSSLPDFRRLWFVGLVSFVVRWLEMLAIALYSYQITNSAFVVAMLSLLRLLPMGLFGAFLGAAADRFERRNALILVVALSLSTTLLIAVLASFDAVQVWHLGVASFINGICWAADNPVRRMMIGDVVGPDQMGRAMSFDVGTNNASRVAGPLLSGVLLAQYGLASVFWLGVALYAASLMAALRMRVRHGTAHAHAVSFIARLREGFECLRSDRRLTGVFLITVIFNVFGWPYTSMIPVIGTDYLHLGPQGVGLLASCDGLGGLIGALLVAGLMRAEWYGRIYVSATVFYLAMVIGFALAPVAALAGVFLLLGGIGAVGFAILQTTLIYRSAPVEMRARLLGGISVAVGMGPLGFLYLGFLAEILSPRTATVAMAVQGLLVMLLTRRYWLPVLRA